jgi:hypothetical protein
VKLLGIILTACMVLAVLRAFILALILAFLVALVWGAWNRTRETFGLMLILFCVAQPAVLLALVGMALITCLIGKALGFK